MGSAEYAGLLAGVVIFSKSFKNFAVSNAEDLRVIATSHLDMHDLASDEHIL